MRVSWTEHFKNHDLRSIVCNDPAPVYIPHIILKGEKYLCSSQNQLIVIDEAVELDEVAEYIYF